MRGLPNESDLRDDLDDAEGGVADTPIEGVLPRENAVEIAGGLIVIRENDAGEMRGDIPDPEDVREIYERGFALGVPVGDEWESDHYQCVRVVDPDTV